MLERSNLGWFGGSPYSRKLELHHRATSFAERLNGRNGIIVGNPLKVGKDTIWLFNIAMENHHAIKNGKALFLWAISHGYVQWHDPGFLSDVHLSGWKSLCIAPTGSPIVGKMDSHSSLPPYHWIVMGFFWGWIWLNHEDIRRIFAGICFGGFQWISDIMIYHDDFKDPMVFGKNRYNILKPYVSCALKLE